jgi:hypothetical protein
MPDLISLVPTIVSTEKRFPNFFTAVHSTNEIPSTVNHPIPATIWDLPTTDHAFVDTPEFYQRLIGAVPPLNRTTNIKIATGIELETLVTCSDGSFDPETNRGSHGWVISDNTTTILAHGSGPADGHPRLMSSYRAELGGLLAVL